MNNSNSFNICPRCGTANSLSSKFCYQCGSALKVPEEPVVCPTCKRVNTSMANFCLSCGTSLKVGAQTKICPRCHKEVSSDVNQCSCGYSFSTVRQVQPENVAAVDPRTGKGYSKQQVASALSTQNNRKGGRVSAFFAVVLALILCYALFSMSGFFGQSAPIYQSWQPKFFAPFNFLYFNISGTAVPMSFSEYLILCFNAMSPSFNLPLTLGNWIAVAFIALIALALALYTLVNIIRIFTGKRSKHSNSLLFVLAIISTFVAVITILSRFTTIAFASTLFNWLFAFDSGYYTIICGGFGTVVLAAGFWVLWIYSLICKQRKIKS